MQKMAAVVIDWEASSCRKGGTTRPHFPEEDDQDSKKGKTMDHRICLREEFHSNLAWWISFLEVWNGASFMSTHITAPHPDITSSSDASGSWKCGQVGSSPGSCALGQVHGQHNASR